MCDRQDPRYGRQNRCCGSTVRLGGPVNITELAPLASRPYATSAESCRDVRRHLLSNARPMAATPRDVHKLIERALSMRRTRNQPRRPRKNKNPEGKTSNQTPKPLEDKAKRNNFVPYFVAQVHNRCDNTTKHTTRCRSWPAISIARMRFTTSCRRDIPSCTMLVFARNDRSPLGTQP